MSDYLRKSDYFYELPEELIAQDPLKDRSSSRLLVLGRGDGSIEHRHFYDLCEYLNEGDCLVFNDTKVIPARLLGVKEDTGAAIELLLLRQKESGDPKHTVWECLARPGKKLRPGAKIRFGEEPSPLTAEVTEIAEEGNRIVRFSFDGIWEEVLDSLGEMPLPPYIRHKLPADQRDRYQTVYARHSGSAAAPTAGLHFTEELLMRIAEKKVERAYVTLHVGLGTFRPVKADNILDHHMHTEYCTIDDETARKINNTREKGGRIICVGTTSVRTLESMADDNGIVHSGERDTDIFIYPGYKFKTVDALITNFHLPESTLLMLVSAFADRDRVLNAYREAVRENYRFFSFGDAMLIR